MKFIFKKDTYRVPTLKQIIITGACRGATVESPHPNHLQQGGIFEFGPWQNEAALQKADVDADKKLIAELRYAGCIGDAADPEVVARVERDVADAARDKVQLVAANERTKNLAVQNAFMELIQRASALQPK